MKNVINFPIEKVETEKEVVYPEWMYRMAREWALKKSDLKKATKPSLKLIKSSKTND